MPELLGVTNPVPGYDSSANNRNIPVPPGSTQVQNIPDPSRVTRSDARTEQQDSGTQQSIRRYDSNFETFLQKLKDAPDLTAVLSRLLSGRGAVVSSGMGEGVAQELARFLEMLKMDQAQLLRFLNSQTGSGTRFGGPLFTLLRGAYQNADSEGMKLDILQFLKRYSDYSSTKHIEGNLLRNLNQMARSIPASFGNQLIDLIAQLQNGIGAGDRAGNLKLLQGKIIPFMSDYVGRTHDLGRARGLLTLLTLDVSRYESGSRPNLLQAFQQLKNYAMLGEKLGNLSEQGFFQLLENTAFAKAEQTNSFANQLVALAQQALRGQGGAEVQNTFRELVAAFLVNESVYMPVNHLVIPLEWNGKMMFSELWVDPDADPNSSGREEDRTLRFLFKVDIQALGFFDLVLTCRGGMVDIQLHCPEKVATFSTVMERAITRILTDNGFQTASVQVMKMERPLDISKVFPKIFSRKDSINVSV